MSDIDQFLMDLELDMETNYDLAIKNKEKMIISIKESSNQPPVSHQTSILEKGYSLSVCVCEGGGNHIFDPTSSFLAGS